MDQMTSFLLLLTEEISGIIGKQEINGRQENKTERGNLKELFSLVINGIFISY